MYEEKSGNPGWNLSNSVRLFSKNLELETVLRLGKKLCHCGQINKGTLFNYIADGNNVPTYKLKVRLMQAYVCVYAYR
jgi:hypothetical protein